MFPGMVPTYMNPAPAPQPSQNRYHWLDRQRQAAGVPSPDVPMDQNRDYLRPLDEDRANLQQRIQRTAQPAAQTAQPMQSPTIYMRAAGPFDEDRANLQQQIRRTAQPMQSPQPVGSSYMRAAGPYHYMRAAGPYQGGPASQYAPGSLGENRAYAANLPAQPSGQPWGGPRSQPRQPWGSLRSQPGQPWGNSQTRPQASWGPSQPPSQNRYHWLDSQRQAAGMPSPAQASPGQSQVQAASPYRWLNGQGGKQASPQASPQGQAQAASPGLEQRRLRDF